MRRALGIIVLALCSATSVNAAINVDIDLRALIDKLTPRQPPKVTCGIATVGYRFIGEPGKVIRYAGESFAIEEDGDIELIATKRRTSYRVDDRTLPLDVWPNNAFGFREVPVK